MISVFVLIIFYLNAESLQASETVLERLDALAKAKNLEQRESDLLKKEQQLKEIGEQLKKQFEDISAKEEKIQKIFKEELAKQEEGLKKADEWFQLMSPENSAAILSGLPDELASLILQGLPSRRTALILEQLPPTKSQVLITKLTRLNSKTYAELLIHRGFCPVCPDTENNLSKNQ